MCEETARLAVIGRSVTEVAHESRHALQCIHAAVEMLRRDLESEGRGDSAAPGRKLAQIDRAAGQLGRLLEEIRGYAAPIQLCRVPVDLAEVWRAAWSQATIDGGTPAAAAELVEEIGGGSLVCWVDHFRLQQVFRNLFENSLGACTGAVRVCVCSAEAAEPGEGAVTVSISDNGPGLTAAQRRRAFEPFFTTKCRGTGLGLAIVQRIVEAHGGRVAWGATGGPGAELVLTLPKAAPQ